MGSSLSSKVRERRIRGYSQSDDNCPPESIDHLLCRPESLNDPHDYLRHYRRLERLVDRTDHIPLTSHQIEQLIVNSVHSKHHDCLEFLKPHANLSAIQSAALCSAQIGDLEALKIVYQPTFNLPLLTRIAAYGGYPDLVGFLVERGGMINNDELGVFIKRHFTPLLSGPLLIDRGSRCFCACLDQRLISEYLRLPPMIFPAIEYLRIFDLLYIRIFSFDETDDPPIATTSIIRFLRLTPKCYNDLAHVRAIISQYRRAAFIEATLRVKEFRDVQSMIIQYL